MLMVLMRNLMVLMRNLMVLMRNLMVPHAELDGPHVEQSLSVVDRQQILAIMEKLTVMFRPRVSGGEGRHITSSWWA
jgi:hypothetical protein